VVSCDIHVAPSHGPCWVFLWTGFELRASILSHSTFCDGFFFEIGSQKLFAWAGFEPQNS
jgi:hypothetical protein